ncbi:MAG TPA: NTP transferase domain-containing protein [Actinomycetota bacterium]|nr:NTP transferase domain-containing protein [Actinomycetota bacterium]
MREVPELEPAPERVRRGSPAPPARPTVGVVLAAGRSERLRPVTGGGSKALVRLGGLRLVERAIRTLLAHGLDRVVVVVGYHAGPVTAVAGRTAPGRVQVVVAEGWEAGNGASLAAAEPALDGEPSFLLVTADHVFGEGALDELAEIGEPAVLVDPAPSPEVWDEATRVEVAADGSVVAIGKEVVAPLADAGAFLLPPDVFAAGAAARSRGDATLAGTIESLAAARRVAAVPLRTRAWWHDIDTPSDLERARRLLRASLRRDSDGPVARILNRRLSIPISWALAPLRPSPDLVSLVAFLVGVASGIALGFGQAVAGGVLAQACSVLDGVDGEVARLTLRAGSKGALLDGFLDRLSDASIIAGLAVWAAGDGNPGSTVALASIAATAGAMLSMATKDRVAALGLEPPSERRIGWLFGGRDGRLLLVAALSIAGLPVLALAAVAATSLLSSAIRVLFARTYLPG